MDGEESSLFCGIERLQVNVGVAVAVALDILRSMDFSITGSSVAPYCMSTFVGRPGIIRLATTA